MSRLEKHLQKKNIPLNECAEAVFDGLNLKELTVEDGELLNKLSSSLLFLCFNDCNLRNLKNFPVLPKLEALELHDNHLSSPEDARQLATIAPNLRSLVMAGNKVSSLEFIEQLKILPKLEELDLDSNPVFANLQNARDQAKQVFVILPNLKIYASFDRELKEYRDSSSDADDANEPDLVNDDDAEDRESRNLLKKLVFGEFNDDDISDSNDYLPSEEDDNESSDVATSDEELGNSELDELDSDNGSDSADHKRAKIN